jgi:hypothetical protein
MLVKKWTRWFININLIMWQCLNNEGGHLRNNFSYICSS